MDKTYNPASIEKKCYPNWEQAGYFSKDFKSEHTSDNAETYCILIPPPNVTGSLHMGHAFQHTIMDSLTRFARMQGKKTLWQPGTDHAGIATQMVVERLLGKEDKSRHDLGREKFIDRIWQWKEESGGTITQQMRRLGDSCDWDRECFTLDPTLSKAVTTVFIELFNEGLIYRGKRLVNWDTALQTAVSDLEVISQEEDGFLWHMRYPILSDDGEKTGEHLIVATTRPETLFGDMAVAVHPEDARYQHLIGKKLLLPLAEKTIDIIADDYVDQDFGSGCVKITPAHDFNDYDVGKRHNLDMPSVFTLDGKLNDLVPAKYQGLALADARKQVITDLEAANLLEKTVPHKLMVPRGDRSGTVIEPMLTDQWFVKTETLAKDAIDAVESGEIRFVPENWVNTYNQWMHNIQDWCISRQLWWGHRIPAWYDEAGTVYVGEDEASIRQKHGLADNVQLNQDQDVLDTWFSSALWPFATLGWPDSTDLVEEFLPTQVLVTGFDIIFFWVARMIMMTRKFTGKVPFNDIYITGLIRDELGQKMSKSKGNVLDPIDVIDGISLDDLVEKRTHGMMQPHLKEKITKRTKKAFPEGIDAYGTDALRLTFAALASTSRDINFDLQRVEGYRNFCNKLWNAARFVTMQLGDDAGSGILKNPVDQSALSKADRWILSRLHDVTEHTHKCFGNYRFDHLVQTLYDFTWGDFCDWYLELTKPVLQTGSESEQLACKQTLLTVLNALLKLWQPIMPFITEEIWQSFKTDFNETAPSLMVAKYPVPEDFTKDTKAEETVSWLQSAITGIRTIRSEMQIAPSKKIPVIFVSECADTRETIGACQNLIQAMARVSDLEVLSEKPTIPAATALAENTEILIPLADLIDKTAELARLEKLITQATSEVERLGKKLQNPQFVDKAPAQVVDKEKAKLAAAENELQKLQTQLQEIAAL